MAPYKNLIKYVAIAVFLMFLCGMLMTLPVSAQEEIFYYNRMDIKNSPLESRVEQGDYIYLGRTYDFSAVTGVSYQYAFWKDWKQENNNCHPDIVIDINYWGTLIHKEAVYLDPAKWRVGNWYYWDSYECNTTYYDRSSRKWKQVDKPLQAENKLAFRIIAPPISSDPGFAITEPKAIPVYTSEYQNESRGPVMPTPGSAPVEMEGTGTGTNYLQNSVIIIILFITGFIAYKVWFEE